MDDQTPYPLAVPPVGLVAEPETVGAYRARSRPVTRRGARSTWRGPTD